MLDKEYFTVQLPSQISEHFGDGHASASLVLIDGSHFWINDIISLLDHYLIVSVYPDKVNDEERELRTKHGDETKTVRWDQLAIPYGMISRVVVTMKGPGAKNLGFHPET